jgi:ABC-type branched-subunit amino acid transport system substrate-binding protein
MRRINPRWRIPTGLWLLSGLCFHTLAAPDPSPLRIGLLLPPEEAEATALRQGAQLAVSWSNQAATSAVELLVRGRPGQWGDDGVEAGRLVLDDAVAGLVAPPGGMPTHLALQVAGRTATPVISLCGDNSVTGAGVPWAVRIAPGTTDEARTIMAGLDSPHARWAALVPADRAGREIARDLLEAAAALGCTLDPVIVVEPTLTDFAMLDPRLPRPWPDGLLIWLEAVPAALSAKHLRNAGFHGHLAGPSRLRSAPFREHAGFALNGFILPRIETDTNTAALAARFETDYRRAFGEPPTPTAALACDAVSLLIHLARRSAPGELHRQFPIREAPPGVTGLLEFDRIGNRIVSLRLSQFRDGEWIGFKPMEPASGEQ